MYLTIVCVLSLSEQELVHFWATLLSIYVFNIIKIGGREKGDGNVKEEGDIIFLEL